MGCIGSQEGNENPDTAEKNRHTTKEDGKWIQDVSKQVGPF
jgi:hypothetical protein